MASPAVDPAAAQVLGWACLGVVNVVAATVKLRFTGNGVGVRLLAHAHDLGQHLAAGLVSAIVLGLTLRWGPRRPAARWGLLVLVSAACGVGLLRDDLVGVSGPGGTGSILLSASGGLVIVTAAWAARWLSRRMRLLPLLAGVVLGAANSFVFERSYLGLHLWLSWAAALLLAASASGLALPAFVVGRPALAQGTAPGAQPAEPTPGGPKARLVRRGLAAALCLWAAWSLVVGPSARVLVEMYRAPGMALAPLLARAKLELAGVGATAEGEWFHDRSALPDVPPTHGGIGGPGSIVLVLVVDAMRHELLVGDTYAQSLPVLHAMRDEGADFLEARSPSSSTVPSLAALFTGKLYSQLYWTEQTGGGGQKLFPHRDPTARLPQLLSRAGVPTAVVVSGTGFTERYGLTDKFDEYIDKGLATGIPAAKITNHIIARLGRVRDDGLFLFTHYFEPHAPYDRGGKGATPFDGYLKEVALVDAELGRLRAAIDRLGLGSRTFIIVTGDHGEAFGEHDTKLHGVTLYDELVHVPLLLHGPGVKARAIHDYVSLVDLGPTVLDLFGQPVPATFMGQSLVPLADGRDVALARPVVVESGRFARAMFFPDRTKIIEDRKMGTIELYDLHADPGELRNLASDDAPRTAERLRKLRAYFEAHALRREGYSLPYRP